MRKKANDVKRGGWSAHKLADESSYAIDTKQKLKQNDVDNDVEITGRAETIAAENVPSGSASKKAAGRKKQSSTSRRLR